MTTTQAFPTQPLSLADRATRTVTETILQDTWVLNPTTNSHELVKRPRTVTRYLTRPTDSQRRRLYTAEMGVRNLNRVLTRDSTVVHTFLDRLTTQHPTLRISNFHKLNIQVTRRNKATSSANYSTSTIKLAYNWGTDPMVVLHEYAHLLHYDRFPQTEHAAHGLTFAGTFLLLVEAATHYRTQTEPAGLPLLAPDAHEQLARAFTVQRVRYARYTTTSVAALSTPPAPAAPAKPMRFEVITNPYTKLPIFVQPPPRSAQPEPEPIAASPNILERFIDDFNKELNPPPVQPQPPVAPFGYKPNGKPYKRPPSPAQLEQLRQARRNKSTHIEGVSK